MGTLGGYGHLGGTPVLGGSGHGGIKVPSAKSEAGGSGGASHLSGMSDFKLKKDTVGGERLLMNPLNLAEVMLRLANA